MRLVRRNRVRIPVLPGTVASRLLGFDQGTARKVIFQAHKKSLHMAAIKPGRTLGGVWIDRFVANRQNINLCWFCERKYRGWAAKSHYRPQPQWMTPGLDHRADCDGCGEPLVSVTRYYPEERWLDSLTGVKREALKGV